MRILTIILSLVCVNVFADFTREEFARYTLLAMSGDAVAQFNVGVCYGVGMGTSKDPVKAAKWFHKAAEQGDTEAQYNLGVAYAQGAGVLKDLVEAAKWYQRAAEQGFVMAQFNLGILYINGEGVSKDSVEAAKWFHKAAKQGHPASQFNFGICCVKGDGVSKDFVEAYAYFKIAAINDESAKGIIPIIEKQMTPSQIEAGQKRSKELQKEIEAKIAAKGDKK